MEMLFHAHSGLRYIVVLAGVLALIYFLYGWLTKKPYGGPGPILYRALMGAVDLQVLLGLVLYLGGAATVMMHGHLTYMLLAVIVLHVVGVLQRRRPEPRGYGLPLLGVVIAAVLVFVGVSSIGRSLV